MSEEERMRVVPKNKEDMTWAEWSAAAGLSDDSAENLSSWLLGVDPTEVRAAIQHQRLKLSGCEIEMSITYSGGARCVPHGCHPGLCPVPENWR